MNLIVLGCDGHVLDSVQREASRNSATIEGVFDDLPSAVNGLAAKPQTPRLFIVHVGSNAELAQLKRLGGSFVGSPIIAIADADKDASMVVKAMRAGAIQVVLFPFARSDFGAALECVAIQFGLAPGRAKTIAVAGVTGGCGTTTIALNLAYELACAREVKCILMELSLRIGVLASYLNVEPRYTTSDLLFDPTSDRDALNQVLTSITEYLAILPGPYQAVEPGVIDPDAVLALIEMTGHLAEFVVLDVPCVFDDLYFKSLSAADSVVLVVQQKVASIRGLQLVCEALPDLPSLVVVNHYDPNVFGLSADQLRTMLNCPGLATIAHDSAVGLAGDHGVPLRLQASRSHALKDIRKLMDALVPLETGPQVDPKSLSILGRLSRALSLPAKA